MGLTDREKYQDKIKRLAGLIRSGGKVYALTGAGCSTESGLPDFRSPGTGLWEKVDPMKYSTSEAVSYTHLNLFGSIRRGQGHR